MIEDFQPKKAEDNDFETIVQKMKQMSTKYKTVFLKKEDRLFITDSSCVSYLETPLERYKTKGKVIHINRGSIEMFDSAGSLQDRFIFESLAASSPLIFFLKLKVHEENVCLFNRLSKEG